MGSLLLIGQCSRRKGVCLVFVDNIQRQEMKGDGKEGGGEEGMISKDIPWIHPEGSTLERYQYVEPVDILL